MHRRLIFYLIGFLVLTILSASGLTSLLQRNLDRTIALTNALVVVTVSFTNTDTLTLRGFYYSEQLPSGLTINTASVKLNGQSRTNYTFEAGLDGDVYSGYTPYRWMLERPPAFAETNLIANQSVVQIVYTASATNPGTFQLQPAAWIGFDRGTTNALFGFSPAEGSIAVNFLSSLSPMPVLLAITNQTVKLTFPTEARVTYVVESTPDLNSGGWQLVTNVTGTGFTIQITDDMPPGSNRFYRIRPP